MDFYDQVYDIVEQIPEGKVMTYGQIARILGRPGGARQVGRAMKAAPREGSLPCHRVLNKSGALAPVDVFGGPGIQRALLEREGVSFRANGHVEMSKHIWLGD